MNRSHQWEICRAIYQVCREQGSPAVNIVKLGPDYFCGETADKKVLVEGVDGCCRWSMKIKIANQWLEANGHNSKLRDGAPETPPVN